MQQAPQSRMAACAAPVPGRRDAVNARKGYVNAG